MKYKGEEKKFDASLISVYRIFLIFIVPIIAYSIAIFPQVLLIFYVLKLPFIKSIYGIFILSFALVNSYLILIFSSIFSTAFFINVLGIKYKEGEYSKNIKDKNTFKYTLYFSLYYPTYKLINIFVLPPIKSFYLSLIGCKIGKNVFLAGEEWIADPCVTEIGENTMIGGRSLITAHLAEDKLIIKRVKIGKNCLIGGDSFIMPGVEIEENVVVGAKTLVTKDKKLKKEKVYAGIPAREINYE
ncbi:MAG: hypothetical protein H5T44_01790 [Thermoplasmatales archaeon]|nr:hypothetical protein [Thermoplasmatales archaeon]